MKLAILIVYVAKKEWQWLIDLQIDQIRKKTAELDYQIYAVAPRAPMAIKQSLENSTEVKLVEVPQLPKETRKLDMGASIEHSYYLDALVAASCADGFTHFATFDIDSFPIRSGWATELAAQLSSTKPLAAVLREENGDFDLPHPSGLFCLMSFYRKFQPQFLPRELLEQRQGAFFLHRGQRVDSGIGYREKLRDNGLDWIKILRTNSNSPHPIIAGAYGNIFFHLGAMSRAPIFRRDWEESRTRRFLRRNKYNPLLQRLIRFKRRRIVAKNRTIVQEVVAGLKSQPERFIADLMKE